LAKHSEARWVELDRDPEFGRARDLGGAIGSASWNDKHSRLGADLSNAAELDLALEQSWSVVFLACLVRGWLPPDERACETIGDFLPLSENAEGRAIQNLISWLEASSDPRLELAPPLSGSRWPRVDARSALSWALSAERDGRIALTDAVRTFARNSDMTSAGPRQAQPIAKDQLQAFRAKSANAVFTMFLALSYTGWGVRHFEDAHALLEHLKTILREGPGDQHLDPHQLAVVQQARAMKPGQFEAIFEHARDLFSNKSNVRKQAEKNSLDRAQTP
jgi:hypothetical protein